MIPFQTSIYYVLKFTQFERQVEMAKKKKNAESELIWLKDNEFEYLSEFIS